MALSICLARMLTVAHVNVFQSDERIQYWVPGDQFWTLATPADATTIRHQSCRVGDGGCGVAIADQRVSDCALGSDLLWPSV